MRELTCIVCPRGCTLRVDIENNMIKSIEGNLCNRGVSYAEAECLNPSRVLTTTVRIEGGNIPMLPVKSARPLPKRLLFDCMKALNAVTARAPVSISDAVLENILDTGIDIIATRDVYKEAGDDG
jgi:CxxC motif-containing protein